MFRAKEVKACRALLGWTQQDLAAASGIPLVTIRRFESSKEVPRVRAETYAHIEETFRKAGIQIETDGPDRVMIAMNWPSNN